MADISFLSSYSKKSQSEVNQIKFYLNLFYDLKTNCKTFESSSITDITLFQHFFKSFSTKAQSYIKELSNFKDNSSNLISILINFCKMFESFESLIIDQYPPFQNERDNLIKQQNTALDEIIKYISDISSNYIKELSLNKKKISDLIIKKSKYEKELKSKISNNIEKDIEKTVNLYSEYEDFIGHFKEEKIILEKTLQGANFALDNLLINTVKSQMIIAQNFKKLFKNIINYKKISFEKCSNSVLISLKKIHNNPAVNIKEFEKILFIEKNIKNYSFEEYNSLFTKETEIENVINSLSIVCEMIGQRKNIFILMQKFFTNISNNYESIMFSLFNSPKIYQFQSPNCQYLELGILHQYMEFLFKLNELVIKKAEEFNNANNLIIPQLNEVIKNLTDNESALLYLVSKMKKESVVFKKNLSKGTSKNSCDLIDYAYEQLNNFSIEFYDNYKEFYNKFKTEGKLIENIKQNSIINIIKQLDKLFHFLVDFIKVNECLFDDFDFNKTIKLMLQNALKGINLPNEYLDFILEIADKGKDTFNFEKKPKINFVNFDIKQLEEINLYSLINESQMKLMKEKLNENYYNKSKKQEEKKFKSSYKDIQSKNLPFDLSNNKERIKSTFQVQTMKGNIICLWCVYITTERFIFYTYFNKTKMELQKEKTSTENKENTFTVEEIEKVQKSKSLEIIKDPEASKAVDSINQEIQEQANANAVNFEEMKKKLFESQGNNNLNEETKRVINEITKINIQELENKGEIHSNYEKHFVVDKYIELKKTDSSNETVYPLLNAVFQILFDCDFVRNSEENNTNFLTYIQIVAKDYDIVFSRNDFTTEDLPLFYKGKMSEIYDKFTNGLKQKDLSEFLEECKKYPIIKGYKFNYHHPIPNPQFMGPKVIRIDDSYKFVFVSPSCFIVEKKSLCSEFTMIDTFYTVVQYKFETEYSEDFKTFKTKVNAYFTIQVIKKVFLTPYIVKNGYKDNEEFISNFMVPNMLKELQLNLPSIIPSLEQKKEEKIDQSEKLQRIQKESHEETKSKVNISTVFVLTHLNLRQKIMLLFGVFTIINKIFGFSSRISNIDLNLLLLCVLIEMFVISKELGH